MCSKPMDWIDNTILQRSTRSGNQGVADDLNPQSQQNITAKLSMEPIILQAYHDLRVVGSP